MKDADYWEQFLNTGRILDYLAYRQEEEKELRTDEGASYHAGTGQCYRDDIKG